ncbi:MAG: DinB family protein [Bacteroidia bacterium]|nr:DinB family protein [Bacteroidia bacterium]
MLFQKIPTSEYDTAILYYSEKAVQGETVEEVLENSKLLLVKELAKIPAEKFRYKYGPRKWAVGEVLQHVISYERIMTERALIIAGIICSNYQYQSYTQSSTVMGGKYKSKVDLLNEFLEVRNETIRAFKQLDQDQLIKVGRLDGFKTSVRMISLCISGHQVHHFQILKEYYKVL